MAAKECSDSSRAQELKKQECLSLISKYTRHKQVRLVQRGNAAIFCALAIAKKVNPKRYFIIPDQGGWLTFRTYPQLLGFEIKEVKTDQGIIDLADLEKKAAAASAFIVTSFAGYFAEQPMKKIAEVCRKNDCLLIEDASGALGDDTLCDGRLADIIVGSFGRWKPVNVGYGGFISAEKKECFDAADDIFSTTNYFQAYDALLEKLNAAPQRLKSMISRAEEVKNDMKKSLPSAEIVHKASRGLNIAVKYKNDNDKKSIVSYCKSRGYEFTECPRYIRLEEKAISIELKRL